MLIAFPAIQVRKSLWCGCEYLRITFHGNDKNSNLGIKAITFAEHKGKLKKISRNEGKVHIIIGLSSDLALCKMPIQGDCRLEPRGRQVKFRRIQMPVLRAITPALGLILYLLPLRLTPGPSVQIRRRQLRQLLMNTCTQSATDFVAQRVKFNHIFSLRVPADLHSARKLNVVCGGWNPSAVLPTFGGLHRHIATGR